MVQLVSEQVQGSREAEILVISPRDPRQKSVTIASACVPHQTGNSLKIKTRVILMTQKYGRSHYKG